MTEAEKLLALAEKIHLECVEESNKNYKAGACTYGELKAAINSTGYMLRELREFRARARGEG